MYAQFQGIAGFCPGTCTENNVHACYTYSRRLLNYQWNSSTYNATIFMYRSWCNYSARKKRDYVCTQNKWIYNLWPTILIGAVITSTTVLLSWLDYIRTCTCTGMYTYVPVPDAEPEVISQDRKIISHILIMILRGWPIPRWKRGPRVGISW